MLLEETLAFLGKHGVAIDAALDEQQLVDREVIDRLVEYSGVSPDESVLEVGPGLGNITDRLLRRAGSVVCVEKSPKFIPVLRDRFKHFFNLEVIQGDALQVELPRVDRVVSNLPYMICEAFFQRTLRMPLESAAFIVPKGFSEILTVGRGGPGYSKLSYLAYLYYSAEARMDVPPAAYYPEPRTQTSIITLTPRRGGSMRERLLRELCRQGDKLTRNALREALIAAGVRDTKRQARQLVGEMGLEEKTLGRRVARLSLSELTELEARLDALT